MQATDGRSEPGSPVPGYAVGHLRNVTMGPAVVAYLERIDATLAPFGGRFLIHGGRPTRLEGDWTGDLIVIRFPTAADALAWYRSPAYREILPLRLAAAEGEVFVVEGVPDDHRATDILGAVAPEA